MNICGCLVHVAPRLIDSAKAEIAAMNGVEIHGASDDGRLVVVVEDTADKRASDIIMAVHQVPGVLSLTLNYHHFEDLTQAQAKAAPTPAPESQRTDA
ncbi:MAG: chaperone NapD [Paracoccus sp. (in: a-proteobacteria)]|uniref:chaperone NapD n=1 Tax=Paracoccus sp. TaxID=267 RepID=UPI0026E0C754|nr:chaperone NapD [Paracoccus sp. (in: a-proteobacteria)]MDO5612176.1 chaperone NapD [Paracoccus sp. (in: a-proteobacteria)]